MKVAAESYIFLLITSILLLIISGPIVHAVSYDYSASTECLMEPKGAQYGGGIIVNPEFDQSLEGWRVHGKGSIEERSSKEGNKFIVATNRTNPFDSFSQMIQLQKGMLYTISAWVQVNEGRENVSVIVRRKGNNVTRVGHVMAQHGCWTMLKGGIASDFSTSAHVLFESKNSAVEIWVDSVSLQPFTKMQWRAHQDHSIEMVRKGRVRFEVSDANGKAVEGALVQIKQTRTSFPFGCGINHFILTSKDYQTWFASRFKYTAFTNDMKWYCTEITPGVENYTTVDAMMQFLKQHGISARGHNVLWDDPKMQLSWVQSLSPQDLKEATEKRVNSVVSRYKGKLIAWDVVNENLHWSFFEDRLGINASAVYYSMASKIDPNTVMFLNEYNTIEDSGDWKATPGNYIKKIEEIRSFPGNEGIPLGIGLQGHFHVNLKPSLAYMRSVLDTLATLKLPIWLTEVSVDYNNGVKNDAAQAELLEEILREAYSHPAVQGIISFSGPAIAGFKEMPLADKNFNNTPCGDVVDKLIKEWKSEPLEVQSDSTGFMDVSLFHGDYDVTVMHPVTKSSTTLNLSVERGAPQEIVKVKIHA